MIRRLSIQLVAVALLCTFLMIMNAGIARAQNAVSCDALTAAYNDALLADMCAIGVGDACYVQPAIDAVPLPNHSIVFANAGNRAALGDLQSLTTRSRAGSAYLLGGTPNNPVKVFVFGDSRISPDGGRPTTVFTLRSGNAGLVCERTRSGMLLSTPAQKKGSVVVNGVNIDLGSTAYIMAGADLLFDQDPRIDRRKGSRNPNAPLCSGFDSDCAFGDTACTSQQRLVWGPYCRSDKYRYIANGLYRITLQGQGTVEAGATDYGVSGDHFSFGSQEFSLPGSYTFCWNGLAAGGSGFETVVHAVSGDAKVTRITAEYLGRDCGLTTAPAAAESAPLGVMTVYNVEGAVRVSAAGQSLALKPQERVRVYFQSGQPVALDGPFAGSYVLGSPFAQAVRRQLPSTPERPAPTQVKTVAFSAGKSPISDTECTVLTWDVNGVKAIYVEGDGVTGQASREVCPKQTKTYTMKIVNVDGSEETHQVTVEVIQSIQSYLNVAAYAYPNISGSSSDNVVLFATADYAAGDEIESVIFRILDESGKEIYRQSGPQTTVPQDANTGVSMILCPFGGETYPYSTSFRCAPYDAIANGDKLPNGETIYSGNTYTFQVEIRTKLGKVAVAETKFDGVGTVLAL